MILKILKWLWQCIAVVDLVILSLLLYIFALLPPVLSARIYRPLFRYWCRVFVDAMGIDLRIHQHFIKTLPDTYILIANHPSIFEDIGIPALFDVCPVAKEEVRDWWIGGRIAQAAGVLFVKRDSAESRKAITADIEQALARGSCVAIFPEGGCLGKRIQPFRWGVFDISIKSGIPIVPVFLHYEAQDEFEWLEQTAPQKIWQILNISNSHANYHVFDAISPQDFTDKASYCDHVHEMYLGWQKQYLD